MRIKRFYRHRRSASDVFKVLHVAYSAVDISDVYVVFQQVGTKTVWVRKLPDFLLKYEEIKSKKKENERDDL
jgi:hypothetical protein